MRRNVLLLSTLLVAVARAIPVVIACSHHHHHQRQTQETDEYNNATLGEEPDVDDLVDEILRRHRNSHPLFTDRYMAQLKEEEIRELEALEGRGNGDSGRHLYDDDYAHYRHLSPCGTSSLDRQLTEEMGEAHRSWKKVHQNRNLRETSYVVPVYFHVFKESNSKGTLQPYNRDNFISKLNTAFKDTPFVFRLRGHGERVNPDWSQCLDERGFKTATRVDGTEVLNIYVCNTNAKKRGLVGFAHYPPILNKHRLLDGVGTYLSTELGENSSLVFFSVANTLLIRFL